MVSDSEKIARELARIAKALEQINRNLKGVGVASTRTVRLTENAINSLRSDVEGCVYHYVDDDYDEYDDSGPDCD